MSFSPVLSSPRLNLPTMCQDRIRLAQRQPCVQDRIRRLAAYQANYFSAVSCPCIYVCASLSLSHTSWGPPPPSSSFASDLPDSVSSEPPLAPSLRLGARPARLQPGSAVSGNRLRTLTRALAYFACAQRPAHPREEHAAFAPFQLGESHVGDRAERVAVVSLPRVFPVCPARSAVLLVLWRWQCSPIPPNPLLVSWLADRPCLPYLAILNRPLSW